MDGINYWAVLAASVSAFVLGGLWYGPLFKHVWCREAGVDPDKPNGHPARVFGIAFVAALGWSLHPLVTEVIGYVTQRTTAMMGAFLLLTLYAAIRALGSRRRRQWHRRDTTRLLHESADHVLRPRPDPPRLRHPRESSPLPPPLGVRVTASGARSRRAGADRGWRRARRVGGSQP